MKKLIFLLPALLLWACSSDEPIPGVEPEVPSVDLTLTDGEIRAAQQIQGFNIDFFKACSEEFAADQNMVCSPFSASALLSMLANCVDDDVRDQITEAIGCEDIEALNSLTYKQLSMLPTVDRSSTMTYANGLWYKNEFSLRDEVARLLSNSYMADCNARDFSDKSALIQEINGWSNEHTNGIIPEILQQISNEAVAILANAIYFKGSWAVPFDEKETEKADFYGLKEASKVDMMHRKDMQHYVYDAKYEAIRMQVGKGAYEVSVILPGNDEDMAEFIAGFDYEAFTNKRSIDDIVDYYLPRFKFSSSEMPLTGVLGNMGMTSLSELRRVSMFNEPVSARHDIYQRTGMEFNEKGAEGAAVTWDNMDTSPGDGEAPDITTVRVDRPFIFFITEKTTGAMLFAGRMVQL